MIITMRKEYLKKLDKLGDRILMANEKYILTVKEKYKNRYLQGNPLIIQDSLITGTEVPLAGSTVVLKDGQGNFIGRGYIGVQNKGIGWIFTRKSKEQLTQVLISRLVANAIKKRHDFFHNDKTNAFRLFNGEGDGIGGLTIDYFDGYYLINWYNEGIYGMRDLFINAINEQLSYLGIYQKLRFLTDDSESSAFVSGIRTNFPIAIKENGIKYLVDLEEGLMPGIFLDQRNVRGLVAQVYGRGKRVLNCFSYTGAFSVAAAVGGAVKTTSVDLATRSREKTIANFEKNSIDITNHEIIIDDIFDYFKYAKRKNIMFDLIIIDPPSFARSKNRVFSVQKDYIELIKLAVSQLAEHGVLVATNNHASTSKDRFRSQILAGFSELGEKFEILEELGLPEDFTINENLKESNYLKVFFVRKLGK